MKKEIKRDNKDSDLVATNNSYIFKKLDKSRN